MDLLAPVQEGTKGIILMAVDQKKPLSAQVHDPFQFPRTAKTGQENSFASFCPSGTQSPR